MMYEFSYNDMNSSEYMNSPNDMNSSEYMNSPNNMNSSEYMNSPQDMNSSEYMDSPNNMNSSDYMNSYVPPCVFVPEEELDVLINGQDKSNTLDNTSKMYIETNRIDTDCIDTDHVIQFRTVPIHMI
jgi:hypothetical protein